MSDPTQAAHSSGAWELAGTIAVGVLSLVGIRLKKKPTGTPALSMHNLMLEVRELMVGVDGKIQAQAVLIAELKERQVGKDEFYEALKEARNHTDKLVSEMHTEFNQHMRDHVNNKAA